MKIFLGYRQTGLAPACALTIGNFDGVHRGHQAMLGLLRAEAAQRGLPSCAVTFEPHPRDYFAKVLGKPELAPARVGTLRDKLAQLRVCGLDQVVILPFNHALASLSPQAFIDEVLLGGLGARYVLVGDDFRFGAQRAGDYELLDRIGQAQGFEVARMNSYEVHGVRVSSTEVRAALAAGDMAGAERLLGRPHALGARSSFETDCSGLVQQALLACGLPGPRRAADQAELGRAVARNDAQRGDLAIWLSSAEGDWTGHSALVVDAERIIHATGARGAVVIETFAEVEARLTADGFAAAIFRRV